MVIINLLCDSMSFGWNETKRNEKTFRETACAARKFRRTISSWRVIVDDDEPRTLVNRTVSNSRVDAGRKYRGMRLSFTEKTGSRTAQHGLDVPVPMCWHVIIAACTGTRVFSWIYWLGCLNFYGETRWTLTSTDKARVVGGTLISESIYFQTNWFLRNIYIFSCS